MYSWQKFVSNNYTFARDHREYHRVYLINTFLLSLMAMHLFFAVADYIVGYRQLAVINAVTFAADLIVLYLFRRTSRVMLGAWGAVLIFTFMIMSFLDMYRYFFYGYYWMVVIVPLAFFLLGGLYGTIYTTLFFGYHIGTMITFHKTWEPAPFTFESIFNIAGASILLVMLIAYYEKSRRDTLDIIQKKNNELLKLADTDALTGLLNRGAFCRYIQRGFTDAKSASDTCAVIMLDLDLFKSINDTYGHPAGDKVLMSVADILNANSRQDDIIARYGGEEFVIFLPGTDHIGAQLYAERLREEFAGAQVIYEHSPISFTGSFGISVLLEEDERTEKIIYRADRAMYEAKRNGRNMVVVRSAA